MASFAVARTPSASAKPPSRRSSDAANITVAPLPRCSSAQLSSRETSTPSPRIHSALPTYTRCPRTTAQTPLPAWV